MTETARSRLPPLDLLRGFEAAARHLSFTRAAEEMFLTQSALSRQIIALEEQLGTALFERRHRELRLTDAGQALQVTAKSVLEQLEHAVARIRRDEAAQPLTVSTNLPFASLWLIPRLSRFRALHPTVDVFISADDRIVDLEREQIDLAVRYCTEAMAPPGARLLFGERLLAVCAPALACDPARPLKRPEDLAKHVLLHIDDERGRFPWHNWSAWLAAIGIHDLARPDFGDAVEVRAGEVPVFWACGVTPQAVAMAVRPPRLITHKPGHMFVTDLRDTDLEGE